MVFKSLEYGTARLVGMGTVGETAVLGETEDFLEVTRQLLWLHVEGAKALDAWGVDDVRCKRREVRVER